MPTKRRFIIFVIVLALMLLIKRAVGQEPAVGWDPANCWDCGASIEEHVMASVVEGVFFGILIGACRVAGRAQAAAQGRYFTGDLVVLRIG